MSSILIENLVEQKDGRHSVVYKEGNRTFIQPNAAFCCHGEETTLSDGTKVFCIYFEIVGLEKNKAVEITCET